MNRMIPLWPGAIPYAEGYPEQIPAMKEFRIPESRSAMLVCPGGGYTMKAEIEGDPVAKMVNAIGVSAYVLDYRILPCSRYAPMTDALRALRLLRSMGYEKVGIMGFSAGGHISAMVATANTDGDPEAGDPIERLSARPDAFALCYTPVDLIHYDQKGSRRNLLGALSDDPETLEAFSPYLHISSDTPPAFIWHTMDDGVVSVGHAFEMARALNDCGVKAELAHFPTRAPRNRHIGEESDCAPMVRTVSELAEKQWFLRRRRTIRQHVGRRLFRHLRNGNSSIYRR